MSSKQRTLWVSLALACCVGEGVRSHCCPELIYVTQGCQRLVLLVPQSRVPMGRARPAASWGGCQFRLPSHPQFCPEHSPHCPPRRWTEARQCCLWGQGVSCQPAATRQRISSVTSLLLLLVLVTSQGRCLHSQYKLWCSLNRVFWIIWTALQLFKDWHPDKGWWFICGQRWSTEKYAGWLQAIDALHRRSLTTRYWN